MINFEILRFVQKNDFLYFVAVFAVAYEKTQNGANFGRNTHPKGQNSVLVFLISRGMPGNGQSTESSLWREKKMFMTKTSQKYNYE